MEGNQSLVVLIYACTNQVGSQASELASASALLPGATQLLAGLLQSSALAARLRRGQHPQERARRWQLGTLIRPGWDQRDEAA